LLRKEEVRKEKSAIEMLMKRKSKYDILADIKILSQFENIPLVFLLDRINNKVPKDIPTIIISVSGMRILCQ
ncbi:MAG: hypothetical protein ACO2PO_23480, partial [Candidatus Calescibacterium sp.]